MGKAKRNRKPRNRRFMYFEIEKGSEVERAIQTVKANIATESTSQAFRYALLYGVKRIKLIGYTPIVARGKGEADHVQLEVTGENGLHIKDALRQIRNQLARAYEVDYTEITNRVVFETAILFAASNHDAG